MATNHLPQLADALQHGNLALFVGADLPQAVTGRPSRADLAASLAQRLGLSSPPPPWPEVAARYEASAGRFALVRWLKDQLDPTGKSPGSIYGLLARVSVATYITSAHDTWLYNSLQEAGRPPNLPVVGADSLGLQEADRPTVVHLFGVRDRPESLVLTAADLRRLPQTKIQILAGLVQPTLANKTILIVGQDLRDTYFQTIYQTALFQAGTIRPPAFAVWEGLADWEKQIWRDQGVHVIDMAAVDLLNTICSYSHAVAETKAACSPSSLPLVKLIVDASVPKQVFVDKAFELTILVRLPSSPSLEESESARVRSGKLTIDWPEHMHYIPVRVEISAPDCTIDGERSQHILLERDGGSEPLYFNLTPKKLGVINIIVKVYQQEYLLGNASVPTHVTEQFAGRVETVTRSFLIRSHPSPSSITWLHLSDLHFRKSQAYDENIVLKALLHDLVEQQVRPDLIAVSGDIAFSGQPAEYDLARRFFDDLLQTTGLNEDRLFLVPGNHDVDRSLISTGARAIGDSLSDRKSANALLSTPTDRKLVFARFKGYAAFVKAYLGKEWRFDDSRYFYVQSLDLAGQWVALLGLNSAWLCGSDQDKASGLLIGERQARAALEQAEGANLKIALLHHPFDWLREFDQNDSAAMLTDGCDFILHGHLHQAAATQLTSPDGAATILACGACYETREFPNMYNWVRLDPSAGTGTVYLRRYSDARGGFWAKDVLTYRNAPDGTYTFSLRGGVALT